MFIKIRKMRKQLSGILLLLIIFLQQVDAQPLKVSAAKYFSYLKESPEDYIIHKFLKYDIVMLGEDHAVQNNLNMVAGLIPELYKAGVYNLGMEFGAAEMQSRLDSLITAPQYNPQVARDMMYYYNVGWAYKAYQNIYKAAWTFNRSLPANARKFRILNLSYQYHWQGFSGQRTPENMAKVFYKGTPDKFRAEIVKKEVLDRHEKALLLVGVAHAFTKYKSGNEEWLGNRLYQNYPGKVFNILLHCPFYNKPGKTPSLCSPANGKIEELMQLNHDRSVGFDLVGTPWGDLPDSSSYSMGYPNFTLSQLFDGYIFLAPFSQLKGSKIDEDFFKNKPWSETRKELPDPDWHGNIQNQQEYWKQIRDFVDLKKRYADLLHGDPMPKVCSGHMERITKFPSNYIAAHNVDIWLPKGYNKHQKYAVLYMHDGQMLFDSTTTWNKQAWCVDEVVSKLMSEKKIEPCIVVGIWNTGQDRHGDYFPQKPFESLPVSFQDSLLHKVWQAKNIPLFPIGLQSDNYLKFLVKELKPYIDSTYSTYTDPQHTFVMGSSMGGLISMYAICEYPDVFGGAACMSTHWPGTFSLKDNPIPDAFVDYMRQHLPSPDSHRIYFDYGTETLDAMYEPLQQKVDSVMRERGYSKSNWETLKFDGADHSERSWHKRLDVPVTFLLGR
ncbi:hypothetical protein NT017_08490 [Prolixibacter sp. NT017]|nr:hypothetical protein NT017_08490 [Prolixibacter sp. NT017]